MSDQSIPDGDRPERPEELSYEDFDDVLRADDGELEPIDLDALDDDLEPLEHDAATAKLLDSIETLDDEIAPAPDKTTTTEAATPGDAEPDAEPDPPVQPEEPAGDLASLDIDALDDELEPFEHDAATAKLLDSIETLDDELEPAPAEQPGRVTIWASEVEPEPEAKPDDTAEQAEEPDIAEVPAEAEAKEPSEVSAAAEPGPPPVLPDTIYRVLITLPTDLGAQMLELRELGRITDMPPPGVTFAAPFRTADLPAVETALADWTRAQLPLQLEITGVQAEVIGAQQYLAAWTLQPEEELQEAQEALVRSLEPLVTPLSDAPPSSQVRLTVGDHIAAQPFPKMIGAMQRNFEPYVWHAEAVALIRLDPASESHEWEVARSFD